MCRSCPGPGLGVSMSRAQKLRMFVSQRLHAAVDEVLAVLEKTIMKYEQEAAMSQEVISRQHALLCTLNNKPLMDPRSAESFTQQLMKIKEVLPEHQDQEDLEQPQVREELQDLDEAEIIEFTYSARPGSVKAGSRSEGPAQVVQVVSSETEDSDDYNKDPLESRSSPTRRKKRGHKPGRVPRCLVCSRTFKARKYFLQHVQTHLREAEPVCGVCGERSDGAESLKLHIKTHRTVQQNQDQTGTRTRERRKRLRSEKAETDQKPAETDCQKNFLQGRRKRKHKHPARPPDPPGCS